MNRYLSIDVLRGLIMVIMAIDHSLGAWSETKKYDPEVALPISVPGQMGPNWKQYTEYPDPWTQFSRVITHVCAPGFQLLAGLGLAISVARARRRGENELKISGDMALRGVILILCDWYIMRFAYGVGPFIWLVLCCIGSATILFSVLRFWPLPLIAIFSAALLLLAPLYAPDVIDVASAGNYISTIWARVAFGPSYTVMYPIFPWAGLFGLGWVLGTIYERRPEDRFKWLIPLGICLIVFGLAFRLFGGHYADRMPLKETEGIFTALGSREFWTWSKYPPSPVFTITTLGWLLLMLGVFRPLDFQETPSPNWQYLAVLGRVALFFYIVHFFFFSLTWLAYSHGDYAMKVPLWVAYIIWIMGLLVVWPVCRWYDKQRQKYRTWLRYF